MLSVAEVLTQRSGSKPHSEGQQLRAQRRTRAVGSLCSPARARLAASAVTRAGCPTEPPPSAAGSALRGAVGPAGSSRQVLVRALAFPGSQGATSGTSLPGSQRLRCCLRQWCRQPAVGWSWSWGLSECPQPARAGSVWESGCYSSHRHQGLDAHRPHAALLSPRLLVQGLRRPTVVRGLTQVSLRCGTGEGGTSLYLVSADGRCDGAPCRFVWLSRAPEPSSAGTGPGDRTAGASPGGLSREVGVLWGEETPAPWWGSCWGCTHSNLCRDSSKFYRADLALGKVWQAQCPQMSP